MFKCIITNNPILPLNCVATDAFMLFVFTLIKAPPILLKLAKYEQNLTLESFTETISKFKLISHHVELIQFDRMLFSLEMY